MSRLGKMPILIPKGVELQVQGDKISVKGPKGTLSTPLMEGLVLKIEEGYAALVQEESASLPSAMHGLCRALLNNVVIGVSRGFEKRLSLVGVGYRAQVQGSSLDLQLGFSHPIKIPIPKSIHVAVDKSVLIVISGIDRQAVGHFAAEVRSKRPPEPYKGKGIRYEQEVVRKKAGKAAKGKGAA